jgi:Predicted membrane protein
MDRAKCYFYLTYKTNFLHMKPYILLLGLVLSINTIKAQDNPIAKQIAERIAQRMADSLQLTQEQKIKIYSINMQLGKEKQQLRGDKSQSANLQSRFQQIENKRDALYQGVLPQDKYLLYIQKKQNLIRVD